MRQLMISVVAFTIAVSAEAQFADFNDRGVTFGHVHLVVADIELHKELWPELFGAELVEKQGYTAVRVSNALIFFRHAEPVAPSAETAVDHFGLTVRNVDEVLSKWRALGYAVDYEETDRDRNTSAHITMPGGVKLALREEPARAEETTMGYIQFVAPASKELMTWYERRFGATRTDGDSEDASRVPGAGLSFEASEKRRLPTDGSAIDHIGFEIEEWDEFIETLKNEDVEFEFGPTYVESLDLWVAFFNDPSGVLVEITHGLDRF